MKASSHGGRGSCQGKTAASTRVRDPRTHERGFLGDRKGGDSFGLTRGECVPRPPSPPPQPPSSARCRKGQSQGGDVEWGDGDGDGDGKRGGWGGSPFNGEKLEAKSKALT